MNSFKKIELPENIEEVKTTQEYWLNGYLEKGWKLLGTVQTSYLESKTGLITIKRYPMIRTDFLIGRPKDVPKEE